jgi:hypothetical protein
MSNTPSGNLSTYGTGEANRLACAHAVVKLRADVNRAWWACETCGTPFSPASLSPDPIDATSAPEYLSIRQLTNRIPYSEGAIRNMMSRGVFRLGVHYNKPNAGRPVFYWPAVQEWTRSQPDRKHTR